MLIDSVLLFFRKELGFRVFFLSVLSSKNYYYVCVLVVVWLILREETVCSV